MEFSLSAEIWSESQFKYCDFGDKRLTARLITIMQQLSSQIGKSLSSSCEGDSAKIEGSYRFLRNANVSADKIAKGGFQQTRDLSLSSGTMLAIEDTTSLNFSHTSASTELGDIGGNPQGRGFMVHSTLLFDAEQHRTLGLIDQARWCRSPEARGKKHLRKQRPYTEKESYKWEAASKRVASLLGEKMSDVISICDREADIYEYLYYKIHAEERFIVRASYDRKIQGNDMGKLLSQLASSPLQGTYCIDVPQKGGRKARTAKLALRSCGVTLQVPVKKTSTSLEPVSLNAVMAEEVDASTEDKERLCWVLLTTEEIKDFDAARRVTSYYEKRWLIEEFHKAWKTGTGAERQRMQSADNLEKMVTLLSFIAVRLLQMKEAFEWESVDKKGKKIPCTTLLTKMEWQVLWCAIEKKRLPSVVPSLGWGYQAIAKLGGWHDSKRTGKVSWATLWYGWFRLAERIDGVHLAKKLAEI